MKAIRQNVCALLAEASSCFITGGVRPTFRKDFSDEVWTGPVMKSRRHGWSECNGSKDAVSSFQIRLADGGADFLGRVEVNLDDGSGWGTVCSNFWGKQEAKVVCRSLGLPYSHAWEVRSARFGHGTGSIQMDNVKCNGSETSLIQCPYKNTTSVNCGYFENAGVICWKKGTFRGTYEPVIENSDSRIAFPRDGGLKARITDENNYTVSICNDRFAAIAKRVACYQLFSKRYYSYYSMDTYDSSNILSTPVCLQLNCTGRERRLSSCSATAIKRWTYTPPGIICGYEKVRFIALTAKRMIGRYIIMENGNCTTIRCTTGYARPKPSIHWVLDSDIVRYGFEQSSEVSGTTYRSVSSITITPGDLTHGIILKCCSNDTFGHSLCTRTYSLFVIGSSKKLIRLNIDPPQELTSLGQSLSSTAPLSLNSEEWVPYMNIHIAVLYSLSACFFLIPLVLVYFFRRKMFNQPKPKSTANVEMEMQNYENVQICNADEVIYEVPT